MKILVINGPNINMLGIRQPEVYGHDTYDDLVSCVKKAASDMELDVDFFQSNCEGRLVDEIQKAYRVYDGIVMNPAAYTHTSIAIPDAIKAVSIPTVEVHISDVSTREEYRQISYVKEACIATVMGKGIEGYVEALKILKKRA